jgi:hypothetical protein
VIYTCSHGAILQKHIFRGIHDLAVLGGRLLIVSICFALAGCGTTAIGQGEVQVGETPVVFPNQTLPSGEIVEVSGVSTWANNPNTGVMTTSAPYRAEMRIFRPGSVTPLADPETGDTTFPLDPYAMELPAPHDDAELPLVLDYAEEIVERANAANRRRADQTGALSGLAAAMRRMEEAAQVTEETTDDTFDDYVGPGEVPGPDCTLVENSSIC